MSKNENDCNCDQALRLEEELKKLRVKEAILINGLRVGARRLRAQLYRDADDIANMLEAFLEEADTI